MSTSEHVTPGACRCGDQSSGAMVRSGMGDLVGGAVLVVVAVVWVQL